jgi:anti-sigma B factor antagonist
MDIKLYESNGNLLARLSGRLVLDECDRLKSTIVPAVVPGTARVSLDLSGVEFIDSAGLGALVGIKVSSNKHKARLALVNPSRNVSDILMVSKLDSIFDIVTGPDAEELIRSLAQPQFEKVPGGSAPPPPQMGRGPAMPVMPTSAPASATAAFPPGGGQQQLSPKERIDQLCKDAVEHMRRADYESAAKCYQGAIDINPDYLPAHNNLAIVYEKLPQWNDKAIKAWQRVLELSERSKDEKHIDRAKKHLQNLQRSGA